MTRHLLRHIGIAVAAGLVLAFTAWAATDPVSKSWFGGVAIDGYDPTAYFDAAKPEKGKSAHQLEWRGAKWRFRSAEAAARFDADPLTLAPRFGGYCTRAMSEDKVVDGNPKVWRLYQGRLYLFYAKPGAELFDQDPDAMIAAAEAVWSRRVGLD